jgi:hypothetical protein
MNFTAPLLVSPGDTLFNSLTNPGLRPGQLVLTRDGRKFRCVKNGAVAAIAGQLQVSLAQNVGLLNMAVPITPVGARTLAVTSGATGAVIAANTYAGGIAIVSQGPGNGQVFGVQAHDQIPVAGAFNITLASDDLVSVALTAASKIDLIANPYSSVVQSPAAAAPSQAVGVAVGVIDPNAFGFIQVGGMCPVLIDAAGAIAVGVALSPSAALAGAVAVNAGTLQIVGQSTAAGVTGRVQGVFLTLG